MLTELKQSVCAANLSLVENHLVLLTWGNVSGRDPATGLVVIKPSGVEYAVLQPEQMVVVDLEGRVVEGDLRPSSDTPTHLELYRAFPELGGVAHTHSTHATAWAQAGRPLPCLGTTHADNFRGSVPVTAELTPAALAGDYEAETGRAIVQAFAQARPPLSPRDVPAVLVIGHGPFTWGDSAEEAAHHSLVLEEVARMAALTEALHPNCPPLSEGLQDKHFLRKHGQDAYYGQK